MPASAAHLRMSKRSARAGIDASIKRTEKNTAPAITTICSPEMDRI